jgi:hypothetical protein
MAIPQRTEVTTAVPVVFVPQAARPLAKVGSRSRLASQARTIALPVQDAPPIWLQHLLWWRRVTTGMTVISFGAMLVFYSWTVYTQQRWSQQYQALEQMKRNERQFLLTQQSITNSLRDSAARSNMVPLVPQRMIEVPAASPGSQPTPAPLLPPHVASPPYPIGY